MGEEEAVEEIEKECSMNLPEFRERGSGGGSGGGGGGGGKSDDGEEERRVEE